MRALPDQGQRLLRAARHLYEGGLVTTAWLRSTFGCSRPTALRDLDALRLYLPVDEVRPVGRPRKRRIGAKLRIVEG